MPRPWIQSLVRELRSHKPWGQKRKNTKKEKKSMNTVNAKSSDYAGEGEDRIREGHLKGNVTFFSVKEVMGIWVFLVRLSFRWYIFFCIYSIFNKTTYKTKQCYF